jgi:YihY family inner membrane protein
VSTATTVPETHHQTGDDAADQLRKSGLVRLLIDAGKRFHAADGTSYARALGLSSVLSLIPALIAAVGLASTFHLENFRAVLVDAVRSLAPGPAGSVLTEALSARGPSWLAVLAGLAGMLASGTLAMVHLERGANRIYGVDEHGPAPRRFGLAFLLASTVGVMLLLAFVVIASGGAIGDPSGSSAGSSAGSTSGIWSVLRWPVGVLLVAVPMTIIFKVGPNRRQPHLSWLLSGTTVAVVLWVAITMLLGLFYEHAGGVGRTYGPLLGVVALLLWAYLTAVAVLYGLAFAAQLEAIRAGEPRPESGGPHMTKGEERVARAGRRHDARSRRR